MTHGKIDPAERRIRGIGDGMIRLSIGLEDADDLIEDIDVALEHV
jgi:cystathionine beta-lyase/cystathionine gamma-synthase